MKEMSLDIKKFSPHLLGDVDVSSQSLNDHVPFLIQRVLAYGQLSDWMILMNTLGIEKIASIAQEISDIDKKSLSFLVALSGRRKEQFKCYTTQQSIPPHWNF